RIDGARAFQYDGANERMALGPSHNPLQHFRFFWHLWHSASSPAGSLDGRFYGTWAYEPTTSYCQDARDRRQISDRVRSPAVDTTQAPGRRGIRREGACAALSYL